MSAEKDWSDAEEKKLILLAQDGDESALESLLSMHQDMIYRTSLKLMAGNDEEAFDLSQEVLMTAFRKIGQFRAESKFSTWLYRMTTNLAKNRYVVINRERKRFVSMENKKDDDDRPMEWKDEGISPRTQAIGNEQMQLMEERLADLEPEWREIIVLRFIEDMSYEEISDTLDLPLGTVKSRINRARRALRDAMQDLL